MSKFAVVKFNDSVYGTRIEIYGPKTFEAFEAQAFNNMMTGMDAQSITWFENDQVALGFFVELGGYEFLTVTRDANYQYPIHVLDNCPFDSKYYVTGQFKTIEEAESHCEQSVWAICNEAELTGDNSELDSDAWIDEDDSYLTAQDERDYADDDISAAIEDDIWNWLKQD